MYKLDTSTVYNVSQRWSSSLNINIPKAGGLFIDDEEVATIQDITDQVAPVDQTASQLVTLTNGHGTRLSTLEGAGYVTQTNLTSTLSTYALQSSLGTTNTTVGNIDTRLTTVENAGYVTASGLAGYNYATQGYVQTAVADLATESYVDTAVTDLATESYVDTAVAGVSGGGGLNSSGVLDISKNGEVAKFQPATSGEYVLVNFKVNSGSDKGFILVQDESANSPGTQSEDLRMTIGVANDFRSNDAHSDELWFQGGGRLCYNVGSWDSELDTIIGTPGSGTSHGGVKHEWRINNSAKMTLESSGKLGIGTTSPATKLHVEHNGSAVGDFEGIRIANHATTLHPTSRPAYEFVVSDIAAGTGIGASKFAIGYRGNTSASRTDRLVIDGNGKVGIGEQSPICKLDVAGAIHLQAENLGSELYTSPDASNRTNTYIA